VRSAAGPWPRAAKAVERLGGTVGTGWKEGKGGEGGGRGGRGKGKWFIMVYNYWRCTSLR